MRAIREKKLPEKPQFSCPTKELLWDVCIRCWAYATEDRIQINEVIKMIKDNTRVSQSPPSDINPSFFAVEQSRIAHERQVHFTQEDENRLADDTPANPNVHIA